MSRTITIRKTITGPTNVYSSEFSIADEAALVASVTVPDTALVGAKLNVDVDIPNASAQVSALLLEATQAMDVAFFAADTTQIGATVSLTGANGAYIWPRESGGAAENITADNDKDIAYLEVWHTGTPSVASTLNILSMFDPTHP